MKKSQNTTALILMVASLLLLATSQWFWLKSEYKDHKRSLYNHSDLLFKETVRTIEDSLVSKLVLNVFHFRSPEKSRQPEKKKKDTPLKHIQVIRHSEPRAEFISDTLRQSLILHRSTDDTLQKPYIFQDSTITKLILRLRKDGNLDSLNDIRRVVTQLPRITIQSEYSEEEKPQNENEPPRQRRRFNFRSASLDSVDYTFNKRVREIGYPIVFTVKKDSIPIDTTSQGFARTFRNMNEVKKRLHTTEDSVIINGVSMLNPETVSSYSIVPNVMFVATPQNLNAYLFSKLRNSAVFSGFLLLLTGLTFFLIYRNLQKQSRLNELKNDLISNVTHELKTPLATLSVALEALQQFGGKEDPKTTREYLEISRNEVSRLSLMVDNILKTSLLENQSIQITPESMDMHTTVSEIISSWLPRFKQLQGNITLKTVGDDFTLQGDKFQIVSVISNLIDNAIKYAKTGPEVLIFLQSEPHSIHLKIQDNGIGIPKEYQDQVFDKFFRVPTGDHHNVKGYGLGLNFVKHIMDLHQGLVTLKSGTDGTTFTLTFKR